MPFSSPTPLPWSPGMPRRDQMASSPQGSHAGGLCAGADRAAPRVFDSASLRKKSSTSVGSLMDGKPRIIGLDITDFFSAEVFQMVIRNPTTAHRFFKFCQSRACGENVEFLQKIDNYNRLLKELTQTLSMIHNTYTSSDAPLQINIPDTLIKHISADIKQTTESTLPGLENIFAEAQEHVEKLLAGDIYPLFVKHQFTASANIALADHKERLQGLGDCFCLTDPGRADNPIAFASDGFVSVTGYHRQDVIHRNCRFLQGELSDPLQRKRLRHSIANCEETVELLLNYRKNGDPFWNLLYVSPLFNERGEVVFFLGGQINCSTTIHSCTDVLKVLSLNNEELDKLEGMGRNEPTTPPRRGSVQSVQGANKARRSSLFKNWRNLNTARICVRGEAGMEPELISRLGKLDFKTQAEDFYTAYSKYLILKYHPTSHDLTIEHYSRGVVDMLCLTLPNGDIAPIFRKDIFKVLLEHSPPSSSVAKALKQAVRDAIGCGRGVSVEMELLTGVEARKLHHGLGKFLRDKEGGGVAPVEEQYVTHWTPLKDGEGRTEFVALTIAPKV